MAAEWPLVGRAEELALLGATFAGGERHGAVLSGAAGVGKTRLARELLRGAEASGWQVWRLTATRATASVPFGAVAALLPTEPGAPVEPVDVLRRAGEELRARAGGRPVLIGIDDAHLLDEGSAALVHVLASSGAAFVLLTVRRGEPLLDPITALWKDGLAIRVELQALSFGEVNELLAGALGGRVDRATAHRLWQATRGNVLFLHELVHEGRERGLLAERSGLWSWDGPLVGGSRLGELIEARLAGLAPEERQLLEVIATGEPLGPSLLRWAGGDELLERLERRGLIAAATEGRRTVVSLSHPLYSETVRAAMGPLREQAVNRGLAAALTGTGCRRRCDVLSLATYEVAGGGPSQVSTLVAAAHEARSLSDHGLAERLARRATEHGTGAEGALALADALYWQGRFEEAQRVLDQIDLTGAGDELAATGAIFRSSTLFWGMGRASEAEAVLEQAADRLPEGPWRDEVIAHRATVALFNGRVDDALRAAGEILERPQSSEQARARALVAAVAAWALSGRVDSAVAAAEAGVDAALAVAASEPQLVVMLRQGEGLSLWLGGRLDELERLATQSYDQAVANPNDDFRGVWALQLGRSALARGDLGTAGERLREASAALRHHDVGGLLPWALAVQAQARAQAGDPEPAREALAESEALSDGAVRIHEAEVGLARAWTAVAGGELSAARRHAVEAADVAAEGGARAVEVLALHEAVRLGGAGQVLDRLLGAVASVEGDAAPAYAEHAAALVADDGARLDAVALQFESGGSLLLAAEAFAEAGAAHRRTGATASSNESLHRARELLARCPGARTPSLQQLDQPGDLQWLTAREREVAGLAARGLTKREIADRLYLSIRTVGNHLNHAYGKLNLSRRDELATLFDVDGPGIARRSGRSL